MSAHVDSLIAQRRSDPRHLAQVATRMHSLHFEDAFIAEIHRRIGTRSRIFVEIGAGSGVTCNTRLLLETGWTGLWVCLCAEEAEAAGLHMAAYVDAGRLRIVNARANVQTVNALIEEQLADADVEFLSLGEGYNDTHIWRALRLKARVVCVAYNASIPPGLSWEVSYDPEATANGNHFGGSLTVIEEIGRAKGLCLVGCDLHGSTAFFVHKDEVSDRFLAPFDAETHYEPPRPGLTGLTTRPPAEAAPMTATAAAEGAASALGRVIRLPGLAPYLFHTHGKAVDQYISTQINQSGTWEALETEIVRRLLGCYDTFLDLGANIGWYARLAKAVMPAGSDIYAFEPEPQNFALLQRNVGAVDENMRLLQMAVSDTSGSISLHLSDTNQGDHRIYASEQGRAAISVPMVTLDEFFDGRAIGPCLLKSDTQGSEPKILRGASRTLAPIMAETSFILEFWPHGMSAAGEDVAAFVDRLSKLPHKALIMDNGNFTLKPITFPALARRCVTDLAPETGFFVDLLLVPPGSAAYAAITDLIT
ncbi:hypothetical protein GCM10007301_24430 [Azorhizobium oxalatiphilum]|uniref:Methyltransferase FkbM domain-containing protein n=1 Tax=Azorhizobium oxalatiphilum TaxID=980631 RepID=A0A917BYT8_9HYPH|nr:FkbM family methyltransferase [Azorhizobium oxalatiphilum]GGF63757.1 hypothetical protein GCM10007301_24430 [Azorhizobium oxalatiphilum]